MIRHKIAILIISFITMLTAGNVWTMPLQEDKPIAEGVFENTQKTCKRFTALFTPEWYDYEADAQEIRAIITHIRKTLGDDALITIQRLLNQYDHSPINFITNPTLVKQLKTNLTKLLANIARTRTQNRFYIDTKNNIIYHDTYVEPIDVGIEIYDQIAIIKDQISLVPWHKHTTYRKTL